jgi:hypothetical protein
MGIGAFSLRLKRPELENDHSVSSSTEGKNAWFINTALCVNHKATFARDLPNQVRTAAMLK